MTTRIGSQSRRRMTSHRVALLAIALAGCNTGINDGGNDTPTAATRAALQVTPAPTPPSQPAAGVELYVQSPFDFDTGTLDLDTLDYINSDPVFRQRLAIPYDTVESTLATKLAALTANPFTGELDGPAGSHVLWTVTLSGDAHFSQRGQPVLSPWGSAADNGVHVDLDTQLAVNLNAHVHIHATAEWIPDPEDFDVPMHALIGGHGRVNLAFFPVVRADNLQAWATLDQADVDIVGLDGTAITAGAVIGAGIGWVTGGSIIEGAFLGAITGEAVLEEAKDQAKQVILDKAKTAFESSREKITAAVNAAVQPAVASANDVLGRIRSQPIPGLGQTLGQLENQLGMSLDIRSVTRAGVFRTAFTARFANVPAQGAIAGRLRFPKQRCEYALISNKYTGQLMMATGIVDANTEMAQAGCGGVDVAQLLHRAYYGANPDAVLETGAPENNLTTWASLGSIEVGTMEESSDAYECPFTITGLPNAAFVDVRPDADSALLRQLSNRRMGDGNGDPAIESLVHLGEKMGQGRFVLATIDGVSVILDHTGEAPVVVEIGTHGPASTADCPSLGGGGGGGVELGFDPSQLKPDENCPQCGAPEQPGADVVDETTLGDNNATDPGTPGSDAIGETAPEQSNNQGAAANPGGAGLAGIAAGSVSDRAAANGSAGLGAVLGSVAATRATAASATAPAVANIATLRVRSR